MDFHSKAQTAPASGGGVMRRGFSLVELLAVILVISILMTVGIMGVRNLAGGKSTATAIASVEGLFEEARLIAVGKGTNARLMVNVDDPGEPENYLRQVMISYEHTDPETGKGTGEWILANRGYQLPQGVYFSQILSKKEHQPTGGGVEQDREDMKFYVLVPGGDDDPPEAKPINDRKTGWNGDYVIYEFNSEGICQTPGASFIIGSGVLKPDEENPRVTGGAERDFSGLMIWRNGRSSLFRSPTQMGSDVDGMRSNDTF